MSGRPAFNLPCAVALGVLLLASACSGGTKKTGATNATTSTRTPTGSGASTRTTVNRNASTTTRPPPPPSITPATGISSVTLPPVAVGKTAELASNLLVAVTAIKAQTLGAQGPGEISGPGIVVSVEIRNETKESVNLDDLVVNAHYGHGVPASPMYLPGQRLEGFLAPGHRQSGRYEFRIAKGQAGTVVLDIEQSNSPNVVIVDAAR